MRTPEDGHTVACLARAMIAAVENYRDMLRDCVTRGTCTEGTAQIDFRSWAQDNGALFDADELLASGICGCICD